jgi:predicted Zn-dependent protease
MRSTTYRQALTPLLLSAIAAMVSVGAPRAAFKFYLVREQSPNAFATPGRNVYVTDLLLYFVKNTEELAGTISYLDVA